MCFPYSKRQTGRRLTREDDNDNDNGESIVHSEERLRNRRHLWTTLGLCSSSFSMFYLIMNVFPYSGFMALHLLNNQSNNNNNNNNNDDDDDDDRHENSHPLYNAANIGPYAALLACSFRLGRIPTAIPWGTCADVYGRKFALVAGNAAMVVGNLLFGLAPTYGVAVWIRLVTGLWNGTMVVVRTSVSEIAHGDRKLEARGVSWVVSMSGYGMLIGPAMGGLLSEPVKQYPSYFAASESWCKAVLREHPFLLPNLIGSIVALSSLLLVLCCVEETLPEDKLRDWRLIPLDIASWIKSKVFCGKCFETEALRLDGTVTIDEGTALVSPTLPSPRQPQQELLKDETKSSVLSSFLDNPSNVRYFFYSMWSYAFTSLASLETFPLFAMTSRAKGGLGLDETSIGLVQTIGGFLFVAGQYVSFSTATKQLGFMRALRASALLRSLLLLLIPLGLYFAPPDKGDDCDGDETDGCSRKHHNWYQLEYLGVITGVLSILGSILMGCFTIGVNASIVDASQRASLNGLQSMIASIGRGVGPIASGYLVAFAMTSGGISPSLGAWAVYGVLVVLEGITYWSTRFLPEDSLAENEVSRKSHADELDHPNETERDRESRSSAP